MSALLAARSRLLAARSRLLAARARLREDSLATLVWICGAMPAIFGFALHKQRRDFSWLFWVLHAALVGYVNVLGAAMYLVQQRATGGGLDQLLPCIFSVCITVLGITNSVWWYAARPLLRRMLSLAAQGSALVARRPRALRRYRRELRRIKCGLLAYYVFAYVNLGLYLRSKLDLDNNFGVRNCVGLPLRSWRGAAPCRVVLLANDALLSVSLINFQTMFVLLTQHTAALFRALAEELRAGAALEGATLQGPVRRHCLLLRGCRLLRRSYSVPIGINFWANAVCVTCFGFVSSWRALELSMLAFSGTLFVLYCALCQRLADAARTLADAAYAGGWERRAARRRRPLLLLLRQAQRPVLLRAAHLLPVDIPTLANTLQFIYQFVTVFKL